MVTALTHSPSLLLSVLLLFTLDSAGADTVSLVQIHNIYVGSLGNKNGANTLRDRLISALKASHHFTVSQTPEAADAVIDGTGELYIRGYYNLNPRAHGSIRGADPIYGGYLSVELKGRKTETLWSYLVTPGRSASGDVAKDLANRIVKILVGASNEEPHGKK